MMGKHELSPRRRALFEAAERRNRRPKLRNFFQWQPGMEEPPLSFSEVNAAQEVRWGDIVTLHRHQSSDDTTSASSRVVSILIQPSIWYVSSVMNHARVSTLAPADVRESTLKDAIMTCINFGYQMRDEYIRQVQEQSSDFSPEVLREMGEDFLQRLHLAKIARGAYQVDQRRKQVSTKVNRS